MRAFRFCPRKKPILPRSFLGLASSLACMAFAAAPARAEPVPSQATLTEQEAVSSICIDGGAAAWARAKLQEGAARVNAASVLPNPSFVVEYQRSLNGPVERETVVGLSVPLSVGGRRGLLRDAAQARREQSTAEGKAALFESALEFRAAYARAFVDRARADIIEEQQGLLDASSLVIERLHSNGEAATYDLMRQRLQAGIHRSALEAAQAQATESLTLLQAWTAQKVALPVVELVQFAQAEPEMAIAAQSQTPELQALRAGSQASSLEARAARRRWVPDPELFAGYRALDTGAGIAHGVAASIAIPLSFFDHGQGEAALSEAQRSLTEAQIERLRREQTAVESAARGRLTQLLHGFDAVARLGADAQELSSRARQLYAAGESSITEMLDAFRAAEEARLALTERVLEIALARLQVMRAAGTMFDVNLDRNCLLSKQRKP